MSQKSVTKSMFLYHYKMIALFVVRKAKVCMSVTYKTRSHRSCETAYSYEFIATEKYTLTSYLISMDNYECHI